MATDPYYRRLLNEGDDGEKALKRAGYASGGKVALARGGRPRPGTKVVVNAGADQALAAGKQQGIQQGMQLGARMAAQKMQGPMAGAPPGGARPPMQPRPMPPPAMAPTAAGMGAKKGGKVKR